MLYTLPVRENKAGFKVFLPLPSSLKKIIRGGSWKDVAYYLQVSTRDYEYADSARSFIGFRTVQDYLGADATANAATN